MSTKIVISPDHEHLRPFIEQLAADGVPADARLIYRARNRVFTVERNGIVLNIKAFRKPSFPNSYVYTNLRLSKARRSYFNAIKLISMGFSTPAPVAYVENTVAGRLRESYYVTEQITADDFRLWLDKGPGFQPVLKALAREMLRLHRAGVYHKDFSPGNVMFTREPDGSFRFWLIDLNRMEFNVFSHDRLMNNFRGIYIESPEETARLARLYALEAGLDPELTAREALARLNERNREKERTRRLKKLLPGR